MKKSCILTAMLFGAVSSMSLFSCSNGDQFTLDGVLAPGVNDSVYYVYVSGADLEFIQPMVPVDTILVDDATRTFSWQTDVYHDLRFINLRPLAKGAQRCGDYLGFVLCPGEKASLKVSEGIFDIDGSSFYHDWRSLSDSLQAIQELARPLQESIEECAEETEASIDRLTKKPDSALMAQLVDLEQQMRALRDRYVSMPVRYMKAHPDADGDIALLCLSGFPIQDSLSVKSPKVQNGRIRKLVDKYVNDAAKRKEDVYKQNMEAGHAASNTAEGKMFVDFEAEYNGKVQRLSDYVGHGKYVLVDFWASWCGPCMAESPTLIDIYNKYSGDNFMVLGVPSSDDPEDTKRAIDDGGIPYPQMMNAQAAGIRAYGITGIPHIILFAPDGKILRRGLRGGEIEDAVRNALQK